MTVDDFEEKLNSILSSPEAMSQIMSLASSLSGDSGASEGAEEGQAGMVTPDDGGENPFALLQSIDPNLLQRAMGLFRTYNGGNNEKVALLQALRPFMREGSRDRLEKAIQVARFSPILRGLLKEFRGGHDV